MAYTGKAVAYTAATAGAAGVVSGIVLATGAGNMVHEINAEREFSTPDMISKIGTLTLENEAVVITPPNDLKVKNAAQFAAAIGVKEEYQASFIDQIHGQGEGNYDSSTDYVVPMYQLDGKTLVPATRGKTPNGAYRVAAEIDEAGHVIPYYKIAEPEK